MNLVLILYTALLFVALTPGVLLTLPKGGSKLTVASVHGIVFMVVYAFTAKIVVNLSLQMEGFVEKKVQMRKKPTAMKKLSAAAQAATPMRSTAVTEMNEMKAPLQG
jgi:hypothetical protein